MLNHAHIVREAAAIAGETLYNISGFEKTNRQRSLE
jgi:hypothetical protein